MSKPKNGGSSKPAPKPTEISDLPQADGADEAEQVRGGALDVPCIKTRPRPELNPADIIPCITPR